MESDQPLKTMIKGAGIILLGLLVSKIFGYIYRIIVARFGVEEYGLLSIGLAFFGILSTIAVFGLNRGVLRYVSYYRGKADHPGIKETIASAIKITLSLSLVLSFLLFIFANKISILFFNNQSLSIVLKLLALAIPFSALSEIFLNAIKAFQKVQYEVYSKNIIENIAKVVLTLFFLLFSLKLFGITLAYTISVISTAILSFYFLEKKVYHFFTPEIKRSFQFKKELLSYSWPLLFSAFTFSIMLWTDTLMLGYLTKDPSLVGIYNAALPTAQLLYVLPYALTSLFFPILTELYSKGNINLLKSLYRINTKWIFMVNVPILVILILFGNEILSILFGPIYKSGALSLAFLSLGYFINYFLMNCAFLIMIYNKPKAILYNVASGTLANVVLNSLLIPTWGMTGAAIATSTSFIVMAIVSFIQSYYITKINPLKNTNYLKLIVAISLPTLLIILIKISITLNLLGLLLTLILFVISYLLILIFTKSFEEEDLSILRSIKNKIRFRFLYNILDRII